MSCWPSCPGHLSRAATFTFRFRTITMNKNILQQEKSWALFRQRLAAVLAIVLTPFLWPIGVLLLWLSHAWNRRDKLIGSLVLPGGLVLWWVLHTGVATACKNASTGAPLATGEPGCPASLVYSLVHPTPSWEFNHIFGALIFLLSIALPLLSALYLAMQLPRNWRSRLS